MALRICRQGGMIFRRNPVGFQGEATQLDGKGSRQTVRQCFPNRSIISAFAELTLNSAVLFLCILFRPKSADFRNLFYKVAVVSVRGWRCQDEPISHRKPVEFQSNFKGGDIA